MRKKNFIKLLSVALSALTLTACIRDKIELCPPLTFTLTVEDKNYHNIKSISAMGFGEAVSEELPFKDYVKNMCLRLTNVATGEIVMEKPLANVSGTEQTLSYTLPQNLPFGTYSLMVWGNLCANSWSTFPASVELHPQGLPGEDVYLASDTLEYNEQTYDYTLGMKRTKGKLIVEIKDMPDDFGCHTASTTEILRRVDGNWNYSQPTMVRDTLIWPSLENTAMHTLLAPSSARNNTMLDLRIYGNNLPVGDVWLAPETVLTTIYRNEITVIRYVYDPCCCRFLIYVLINDHWESLHSLEID